MHAFRLITHVALLQLFNKISSDILELELRIFFSISLTFSVDISELLFDFYNETVSRKYVFSSSGT